MPPRSRQQPPGNRRSLPGLPLLVTAVALGGGLGSVVRYLAGRTWPDAGHRLPWTTLTINLTGSLLLGMLVVAVSEVWHAHPLVRPFFGTGILGGYTTFSTFAVQDRGLAGPPATVYVLLSVLGGIVAAAAGMALVRSLGGQLHQPAPAEAIDPDLP